MVTSDLRQRVNAPTRLPQLVYALILTAMMIEVAALIVSIALGVSLGDYFSSSKAVRDAAAPGSEGSGILSQIGTISAVEAWLKPLKILGVALFFFGISIALWSIIRSLRLRGEAMLVAIPAIVAARKSNSSEG